MNAKQLNEIFERQGIGHVKLVRPFFDSDGSTEVHAIVVDDDGNDLQATDKWHYASIEINSNTFGYDAENEKLKELKSRIDKLPRYYRSQLRKVLKWKDGVFNSKINI